MRFVPLTPARRPGIAHLIQETPAFDPSEVDVAMELVDIALDRPEQTDYHFILAEESDGQIAGYICFGPTPMTEGTYDLYWLATHPDHVRKGIARKLIAAMDEAIKPEGARLVRVETASQEAYGAAVGFYHAAGFTEEARIRGFYKPDDDLIIFVRRLA